ncbi:MAG TPA: prolyl oligopeptidase family serine peptidase [Thermoanaerobaculia bacterium]|nr:prolyl oligopeptidase family serine peptidase [Thermoanaerobaculia bacterium]
MSIAQVTDPYLWLEEVDGERALAWVRDQNERTRRELAASAGFEQMEAQALAALNSESRVPSLTYRGNWLYNLWKSPEHPRGLYRRTSVESLHEAGGLAAARWTTVLDIDDLSRREKKMWVLKRMNCLPPENRRCLVSLSAGGGDAVEVREFDAETLRFVEGGFFLPEAKSYLDWIDAETLFVGTDLGPGSLTESGYPRVVKVWKRGTPLSAATTIFESAPSSVGASGFRIRMKNGHIDLIDESLTTWTARYHQLAGGQRYQLALPASAVVRGGFDGQLVVSLQEDWPAQSGSAIPAGSVVLVDPASVRVGGAVQPRVQVLVEPTASSIVEGISVTDESILITTLDNVRGRLYRFAPVGPGAAARISVLQPGATPPAPGDWSREMIAFPDNGALTVMSTRDSTGEALVAFESFVDPPTLYHVAPKGGVTRGVAAQQATFEGSRFEVTQQWATSRDGTRIPYFVVAPRGMARNGQNPTHIFTYGGFRNALTPSYSGSYEPHYGAYGKLWLERGGVFVLANIRGGGEFGPAWHSSVLKENRQKVFEDFEAVAAGLVASGITSPEHLGIEGRSNGGLLTFGTMARRPELYGAIISGSPLADMLRYHELLAGASWMAEYGDPRIPEERAFISKYSPYQRLRADADYPPVFVYASTRDDRVHPGHARKMVARMQELGHDVWYYENIEGGHGASSTNDQLAYRIALSYAFLWKMLR